MVKTRKGINGDTPNVNTTPISSTSIRILRKIPKRRSTVSCCTTSKTNEIKKWRVRKCVVRIKRCKLPSESNVANTSSYQRPLSDNCNVFKPQHGAQAPRRASVTNDICDISAFEPVRNSTMCHGSVPHITPLRVRLKRVGLRGSPGKECSPPQVNSTPFPDSVKRVSLFIANKISPPKPCTTPCEELVRRNRRIQSVVKGAPEAAPKPQITQNAAQGTEIESNNAPTKPCATPCKVLLRRNRRIQSVVKGAPEAAPKPQVTQNAAQGTEVDSNNALIDKPSTASKRERFFYRNQLPSKRPSSILRNVYEFLNESEVNDDAAAKRKDPAADIIQQMIQDGRVCAMMRSKSGKERARPVRQKRMRPVGKRKQCSIENATKTVPVELPPPPIDEERALSPIYEPEVEQIEENEPEHQTVQPEVAMQLHQKLHRTLPEGAYSPLARSILLNQTKTNHAQDSLERRRELLDMAKQFISTPTNRKSPSATAFTPKATTSECGASPWRVPVEVPLPNTFVFGLNTSQLPSYSSDFVRRSHVYVPDEPIPPAEPSCPALNAPSIESSFNDSNCENVPPAVPPPVSVTFGKSSDHDQENDENLVHLPNPRQTLQHRVPFKDINILDVVVLPSWKKNQQLPQTPTKNKNTVSDHAIVHGKLTPTKDKSSVRDHVHFQGSVDVVQKTPTKDKSTAKGHVQFVDSIYYSNSTLSKDQSTARDNVNLENSIQPTDKSLFGGKSVDHSKTKSYMDKSTTSNHVRLQDSIEPRRKSPGRLFGFEEFLDEDEENITQQSDNRQNETLNEKLQRLKELRPRESDLPQVSRVPLRYDYDDLQANDPRQRNIKEMLCSTMIGSPVVGRALPIDESLSLFKDQDPETTFDEKKPRRTYVHERPKRKRKQRVHVLFIDTDSSENEDDEQDSHDKSNESPRKAKRTRRDVEHEAKINEFVTSFNQQCEEVEKFPLIIE